MDAYPRIPFVIARLRMMRDGDLIDKQFTQREATEIFVRVNLADELYSADSSADSADTAIDADEFHLMVARLAREKVGSMHHAAGFLRPPPPVPYGLAW